MLGESVGSYKILSKLSEGGMGVVYRAEHSLMGKLAAVKLLHPELSSNQEIVNRFFNEAKAATAIRHPGIVEVFDFGYMSNGMAFIVMEFLDGEPLSKRLAGRGRLEEREALSLIRGTASALAAAHAKGIIHRDLKPDNIFLVPDPDMAGGERPKLLDFGIAKLTDSQTGGIEASKTRTGAVMGTPTYMSPEQCRGAGHIDHRSDLYALGCILYEMVCGVPPFTGEGVGEIIGFHLFMAPVPPRQHNPSISENTEALIMNLLAKKPEDRIQTAMELAKLLGHGSSRQVQTMAFAQGVSVPTPPPGIAQGTVPGKYTPIPGMLTVPMPAANTTQAPTTLSGSAAQTSTQVPAKKSKVGLIAGLGVLLVGGGIAAAIALGGGGGDGETSQPAANVTEPKDPPPSDPPPPVVTVDAGVAAVVVAPPDAAPVVAAPDAGATVVAADKPNPKKPKPKKPKPKPGSGSGSSGGGPSIDTDL